MENAIAEIQTVIAPIAPAAINARGKVAPADALAASDR